jgi:hypothetical protein
VGGEDAPHLWTTSTYIETLPGVSLQGGLQCHSKDAVGLLLNRLATRQQQLEGGLDGTARCGSRPTSRM